MEEDYLKLSTEDLLERFGSGKHKPGAGSAAALQGLLSVQLARTVLKISLTKEKYIDFHPEFVKLLGEIEATHFPCLVKLFQDDSAQFHKVFSLRKAKKKADSVQLKNELTAEHSSAVKKAIEIPIEIGNSCFRVAEIVGYVFDHGYKAVRGDSFVGLNSAVSAVGGCLTIIDLNVLSLVNSDWTDDLKIEIDNLRQKHQSLLKLARDKQSVLESEAASAAALWNDIESIFNEVANHSELSMIRIEEFARTFQNSLWAIRGKNVKDPKKILDPEYALKKLGYHYLSVARLEQNSVDGEIFDVAGIIDKKNKTVTVAENFTPQTRRFTAAHELAHAIMHNQQIMHRDRPTDGSQRRTVKDVQEIQADKFAACFLMPRSLVTEAFQKLYGTTSFELNDDSAYALEQRPAIDLRKKYSDTLAICRVLAGGTLYGGKITISLAEQFQVSIETMAIRLLELNLVKRLND